ncbi:hypothetical protein OSTOST_24201, partial [Ostertagia ostertagi]
AENVQEKTVIILSDVGSTFCTKTQNANENEFTIAEEWRRNKVRIVYVAVETKYGQNMGGVPGGAHGSYPCVGLWRPRYLESDKVSRFHTGRF